MAFLNLNLQFKDVSSFAQWLATLGSPSWSVVGSTFHNTFVPTLQDWRGAITMDGMANHYENVNNWDRGPHLFVAKGSPNPEHDGIWVMTSPKFYGIHAGICNGDNDSPGRFGVELVGDYNTIPPNTTQLDFMTSAIAAMHQWAGIGSDVNAHRDCMPGRTCPGNAFYNIRETVDNLVVNKMAAAGSDIWSQWGTLYFLPTNQRHFGIPQAWYANMTGPAIRRLGAARSFPVYSVNNVTQLFDKGMIIYRSGETRVILYSEFRVP